MKNKTALKIKPECINMGSKAGRMLVQTGVFAEARQVGGTHYANNKIQPWEAMEAWMTPEQVVGFLRGNAIKYLARADSKGGLEDIKKAQHYIDKLVTFSEGQVRGNDKVDKGFVEDYRNPKHLLDQCAVDVANDWEERRGGHQTYRLGDHWPWKKA